MSSRLFVVAMVVLLASGCGSGNGRMDASKLERFLLRYHVTPGPASCRGGDDGYDFVCSYRAKGRLWKQGFLVDGPRLTTGTSPTLVADHLPAGPRPEPERRAVSHVS